MPERVAIPTVGMNLGDFANGADLNELVGFDLAGEPAQGPVDGELFAGRLHGGDHAIDFREGGCEGFLDEDVDIAGGDLLNPFGVAGGGGAKDDDVGLGFLETSCEVGGTLVLGEVEFSPGFCAAKGVFVGDADDGCVRVIKDGLQEVAHVKVVEVDVGDLVHGD